MKHNLVFLETQRRRHYEHLDDIVCDPFDRLDRRFRGIARRRWAYSPAARISRNLSDLAFRDGGADNMRLNLEAILVRFPRNDEGLE